MKKIILLVLILIVSLNTGFAYTQSELDNKKLGYTRMIQEKIWDKIDALPDNSKKKLITLINKRISKTINSESLSDTKKLNSVALLESLKDVLDFKLNVQFIEKLVAQNGYTVSVDYTLTLEDWTVIDTSIGRVPFTFVIWEWQVIEWWETWLIWRKTWEKFNLIVAPEQWYGLRDEEKTHIIPKTQLKVFEDNWFELVVWTELPTQFWTFPIIWLEWDDVILDVNHHLAWKTLFFDIEVKRIEEINSTQNY